MMPKSKSNSDDYAIYGVNEDDDDDEDDDDVFRHRGQSMSILLGTGLKLPGNIGDLNPAITQLRLVVPAEGVYQL